MTKRRKNPKYKFCERFLFQRLIEEVKKSPEICRGWNKKRDRERASECWKEISTTLGKPVDYLKKRWAYLRYTFRGCLNQELKGESYRAWVMFDDMKFLKPYLAKKYKGPIDAQKELEQQKESSAKWEWEAFSTESEDDMSDNTASTASEREKVGASTTPEPEEVGASTAQKPKEVGALTAPEPEKVGASIALEPEDVGTLTATEPEEGGADCERRLCGNIFVSKLKCFSFTCTDCEKEFPAIELFLKHVEASHLNVDGSPCDKTTKSLAVDGSPRSVTNASLDVEADPVQVKGNEDTVEKPDVVFMNANEMKTSRDANLPDEAQISSQIYIEMDPLQVEYNEENFPKTEPMSEDESQDRPEADEASPSSSQKKVVQKLELKCELCGKTFNRTRPYKHHMINHTNERPFKCDYCEKSFARLDLKERHHTIHSVTREQYICGICEAVFVTPTGYEIHMSRHTNSKKFKCNTCCDQSFATSTDLRRHQGIRPFECEICKKRYFTRTEVKVHMRSHTKERPFVCEMCGNGYITSSHLQEHKKVHTNLRAHKCTICEASFNKMSSLREHMLGHGEKRFVCQICGNKFFKRYTLNVHLKVHQKG